MSNPPSTIVFITGRQGGKRAFMEAVIKAWLEQNPGGRVVIVKPVSKP